MNEISLFIRKLTVPPVFAALMLIITYVAHPEYYGSFWHFAAGIVFLAVLPVLAYPLQKYIPKFRSKGREGQRTIAMLFSAAGYFLGTGISFLYNSPIQLKIIYLEYLLCGILILLFNKLLRLRASGHACGIVGPVLLLAYLKLYIPAIIGTVLIIPVFVSSVKTKRHTVFQLIAGSIIPIAALIFIHFIII